MAVGVIVAVLAAVRLRRPPVVLLELATMAVVAAAFTVGYRSLG